MTRDQLLILIIIIVVFIVFVVALCFSLRIAHRVRSENARLTDLVRHHEQRLQALASAPPPQDAGASVFGTGRISQKVPSREAFAVCRAHLTEPSGQRAVTLLWQGTGWPSAPET